MRAIAIIVTVATDAVLAEMRETVAAATDAINVKILMRIMRLNTV